MTTLGFSFAQPQLLLQALVHSSYANENPDPELDLDYVPNVFRSMPTRAALSNSFGLGGHNATLVVRKYEG